MKKKWIICIVILIGLVTMSNGFFEKENHVEEVWPVSHNFINTL